MARFLLPLLLLVSGSAHATLIEAFGVDELTARADRIIEGRVVEVQGRFEGRLIVSTVRVATERCYKGACADHVVEVVVPGGVAGDFVAEVAGAARFEVGERVVLFLATSRGLLRPVGMGQGKFRVHAVGDELRVTRGDGLALIGRSKAEGLALQDLRHDTLLALVERALDAEYSLPPVGEAQR